MFHCRPLPDAGPDAASPLPFMLPSADMEMPGRSLLDKLVLENDSGADLSKEKKDFIVNSQRGFIAAVSKVVIMNEDC